MELLPLLTPLELELEPEPELEPHWLVDSSEPSELRPFASAASGCIIAMVRAFRRQSALHAGIHGTIAVQVAVTCAC